MELSFYPQMCNYTVCLKCSKAEVLDMMTTNVRRDLACNMCVSRQLCQGLDEEASSLRIALAQEMSVPRMVELNDADVTRSEAGDGDGAPGMEDSTCHCRLAEDLSSAYCVPRTLQKADEVSSFRKLIIWGREHVNKYVNKIISADGKCEDIRLMW